MSMNQSLVDKVIELKRRTDATAMICRKALAFSEWDLDKAEAQVKFRNPNDFGILVERRPNYA